MPSKIPARGGLYLAYSAGPSMLSAVSDALALLRGNPASTPRERVTVLAEFARARSDAKKLKEAARKARADRYPPSANDDIPA